MIPRLGDHPSAPFPDTDTALSEPDGLLAFGGDLSPERLLNAYSRGVFPWYSDHQPIMWWSPAERCVIQPQEAYISRSLARLIRKGIYHVTADVAFEAVVHGCINARTSTWITPEMAHAYSEMHHLGFGHSVEVWSGEELVGGMYGLSLGKMFFGESMYSAARDASKLALVSLCKVIGAWDFSLLDCQVSNDHLHRMGAQMLSREEFEQQLSGNSTEATRIGTWTDSFAATLLQESKCA